MGLRELFFLDDMPVEGMDRDDFLGDYDQGGEIDEVVEAIKNILDDEGVDARVDSKLIKTCAVPEEVIERYGLQNHHLHNPSDYVDEIYRIRIIADNEKVVLYYIPDMKEIGYFFRRLDDAIRAAEQEIEDLVLFLECYYGD